MIAPTLLGISDNHFCPALMADLDQICRMIIADPLACFVADAGFYGGSNYCISKTKAAAKSTGHLYGDTKLIVLYKSLGGTMAMQLDGKIIDPSEIEFK